MLFAGLTKRLAELFKVRAGEERTVSLVLAMTSLVTVGGMVGGNAVEALFFSRQGTAALPALYMALGITNFVVSLGITAVLGRVARVRVYLGLPLVLATSLALQRVVLAFDIPWTYAVFWLLMNVEGLLQGMLTWGIASIVCDTRQAKRLFPLFAAGGIFGGVVGGFVTRPLAGLLGTENLLAIWSGSLVLVYLVARTLLARHVVAPARSVSLIQDMQAGYRYVRSSPLWRDVSAATVLFAVLYFSLTFPFAKAATRAYPSAEQLAGFFGLFGGASTGAAFLASLFVANRLFARLGIMAAILVFPLLYATGFATLLVTQTAFSALVAFRFAQLMYLQGIASPAYESVFNVIPRERRDQVRAFVNGVPDQAGIVIAGAVLLVGDRTLDAAQLAAIGLGAALVTAYIWWRASRQYARALVRTLRTGQPIVFAGEEEPFGGYRRDAAAVSAARAAARDPDPRTRHIAVEVLGQLAEDDDLLITALDDDDDDVRRAAANALARRQAPLLSTHLDDVDPAVRATCAAALLEVEPRAWPTLDALLHSGDAELRLVAVRGLGSSREHAAAEAIMDLATDTDSRVRAAAVRALPAAGAAALPLLAAAIRDEDRAVRRAAADALVTVGTPALEIAIAAVEDGVAVDDALDALRRMPTAAVAARVREVARRRAADAGRYHAVARGLRGEDERTAFARDALVRAARTHGAVALGALASLASDDAYEAALAGLRSRERVQRANAVEALEAMGDRELVRPLLAVFEDLSPADRPTDLAELRADTDAWIREVCTFATARPTTLGGAAMETLATLPTMERILFLRQVPLFAELPPGDLKQIAAVAGEQLYDDGTLIAREGDAGNELLVIVEGEVGVVTGGAEIARRKRGDYVGEMAVLDGEPRSASLVARGTVRALRIGRRELETILRERPETSHAMLVVLIRRVRELSRVAPAR
ncbi:MAG: cyclic nucleotide-binding domain-containing protein [Chloroflexi bacterium]|nr:MAG: cyclic nucleotide-binding domain-containing protein [Chloroflexota bacterium]